MLKTRLGQDRATEGRGIRVCPCPEGTRYAGSVPDREPTRSKVGPSVVLAGGVAPNHTLWKPSVLLLPRDQVMEGFRLNRNPARLDLWSYHPLYKSRVVPVTAKFETLQRPLIRISFLIYTKANRKSRPIEVVYSFCSRNEEIRTHDPIVPNDMRYQTALHSEIFLIIFDVQHPTKLTKLPSPELRDPERYRRVIGPCSTRARPDRLLLSRKFQRTALERTRTSTPEATDPKSAAYTIPPLRLTIKEGD